MKKEKVKYSMGQNVFYMIQKSFQYREKKILLYCFLLVICGVASYLVELYLSPTVLGALESNVSFSTILFILGSFLLVLLISKGLQSYIENNSLFAKVNLRSDIQAELNQKCAMTSYPNLLDDKFLKLSSSALEATQGNSSATEWIWQILTSLLIHVVCFVIYLFLLVQFHFGIMAFIVITSLITYFLNRKLLQYRYDHREEEGAILHRLNYQVGLPRTHLSAKDIRIFGMKNWIQEITNQTLNLQEVFQKKVNNRYLIGGFVIILFTFLRDGLAYLYLIIAILNHQIDLAEFILYLSVISNFATWITGILDNLYQLLDASLKISVVREFIEYPEPFLLKGGEPIPSLESGTYELRFEHVFFRYPKSEEYILKDINLVIHPNEKIAVVGKNGAGKTTFVLLLCGFLEPTKGRILLNGQDITQFNRLQYYELFSVVFQKFSLLAGTIAMNVAQSEDKIDYQKVEECIAKAGLEKKIASLPKKLETKLDRDIYDDAIELSGGEMQRLMLARALYRQAPFMVLDEPTAALDPIAESDLYQKYNELTKGCTSIYISHRLASTQFCDRILLIQDGKILEEGTHKELLKRNGVYKELFDLQSKYYQEGDICEKESS